MTAPESPAVPPGPPMIAPFREVIHNIRQYGEQWSWRCGVQWTKASEGWTSGACRYDHDVDSWDELVEQATAHLARWHGIVPALVVPDTGRADAYGATVRLSREDWGVVIDALIQHRGHAVGRKAANSESTSDLRVEACDRMLSELHALLSSPAVPDTGQARESALSRSPEFRGDRRELGGPGRLPCGFCNHGGWGVEDPGSARALLGTDTTEETDRG